MLPACMRLQTYSYRFQGRKSTVWLKHGLQTRYIAQGSAAVSSAVLTLVAPLIPTHAHLGMPSPFGPTDWYRMSCAASEKNCVYAGTAYMQKAYTRYKVTHPPLSLSSSRTLPDHAALLPVRYLSYKRRTSMPVAAVCRVTGTPSRLASYGRYCWPHSTAQRGAGLSSTWRLACSTHAELGKDTKEDQSCFDLPAPHPLTHLPAAGAALHASLRHLGQRARVEAAPCGAGQRQYLRTTPLTASVAVIENQVCGAPTAKVSLIVTFNGMT